MGIAIVNIIIAIVLMVGLLGSAPFIVTGVVFLVKSKREEDGNRKKKFFKRGIIFIILPFALVFFSLLAYAVLNIALQI